MARIRTDARRQAIIDHAGPIFRACGYDRTSMAQIAARVGGSKTTLYGYFKSKQDLFVATMAAAMDTHIDALVALLDRATDDPRRALLAFGTAYLDLVLSPEITAMMRTCIAEGRADAIGSRIYERGPCRAWTCIAEQLQSWIDRGLLRSADSLLVALHLRGLLEAGMIEPALFGAEPEFQRDEAVAEAIDVFLRAYGV